MWSCDNMGEVGSKPFVCWAICSFLDKIALNIGYKTSDLRLPRRCWCSRSMSMRHMAVNISANQMYRFKCETVQKLEVEVNAHRLLHLKTFALVDVRHSSGSE